MVFSGKIVSYPKIGAGPIGLLIIKFKRNTNE